MIPYFYEDIVLKSPTFKIKSKRNFWLSYNLWTTDKYKLKFLDRVLWRIDISLSKEEIKLIEKANKSDKEEFFKSIYNKIWKEFYYSMDLVKDSKVHFNKLCLNLENIISNSYLNKLENKFLCLLSEGWKKIEWDDWEIYEKELYSKENYNSHYPYYLELIEDIKKIPSEISKEEFSKIAKILEEKIEVVNFLLEEFLKKQKDKRKERIRKIFLLDKLEKLFKVK